VAQALSTDEDRADELLVDQVVATDNLCRAWEVVRDRDLLDGVRNPGVLAFGEELTRHLDQLAEELRDGSYRPGQLNRVEVPKASGAKRVLRIPQVRDRIVERAVHQVLVRRLDWSFSPWSFAFRPGLGVPDAVGALSGLRGEGNEWVVRADFRDCFDSLDRGVLLECLQRSVGEAWLTTLVARFLERPSWDRARRRVEHPDRGAAQGSPLSPLLCNLYLASFDEAMLAHGDPVVRYADDLAMAVDGPDRAAAACDQLREEAGALSLRLAEEKTYTAPFAEGVPFLGVEFTSTLPVDDPEGRLSMPREKVVYVMEQGALVQVRHGHLRVVRGEKVLLSVPVGQVGQVVTFGSVGISAGLRDYALREQVEITLCSRRGGYQGRLDGPSLRHVRLRREQFRRADDGAFALDLARAVVAGKIANQRALVQRYRRRKGAAGLSSTVAELAGARDAAVGAANLKSLLGVEGAAGRAYFRAWPSLLPEGIPFPGRNRRPPTDVVNAALGYAYTVLTAMAISALVSAGLEYDVGFLHGELDGRPSLALDLMEEFRPLLIDTVVLECFRRGVLGASDGRPADTGKGVWLTSAARDRLVAALEERMLQTFVHVPTGQRTTYRRALYLQARQIANLILGRERIYTPVAWR